MSGSWWHRQRALARSWWHRQRLALVGALRDPWQGDGGTVLNRQRLVVAGMPTWAGHNPRLVHKHNEAANDWLQANGGLKLAGRWLAHQRAYFPGRKQLGSDKVLIFSCCHNPSSITFGLYLSSAVSEILCRFAAGLSSCQRLACLALAVSMALSGLGGHLQSVITPLTIKSLKYVWNQRG